MDPQEQPEDQSNVSDRAEDQKEPEDQSNLSDRAEDQKEPEDQSNLSDRAEDQKEPEDQSNLSDRAEDQKEPEDQSNLSDRAEDQKEPEDQSNVSDIVEDQKEPEDTRVTEDNLPQVLSQNEESPVNRVDEMNTSAQEETHHEEPLAEQDQGEDLHPGAEDQEFEEEIQEGSKKSPEDVLAETEAVTTEFTKESPETYQAEKLMAESTSEALVEIEPNNTVAVKDSKVGSDEPVEVKPSPDEERDGETSEAEKTEDMPKKRKEDMTSESKENVATEDLSMSNLADPNASVTVKVKLLPTGQMITVPSVLGQTVGKLHEFMAGKLKMDPEEIIMLHKRAKLDDFMTLSLLGVAAYGTIELELKSADPENNPIKLYKKLSGLELLLDILSINVREENGEIRTVLVEVDNTNIKKPFLGGFRHKVNGKEFHNASVQTVKKLRFWPENVRFSRSTQTYELRNKVIQTAQDTSTQMTKIGCYVSVSTDKLIVPGKYFTSKEKEELILEKVIILQKYLRQYLAKMYVKNLKMQREKRRQFERQRLLQRKLEKEKRIKLEFERRMHPRANEDFDTLYDALEKWRLEEIAHINATMTGAERKAALYMLLNQETEHLAAIGRHRLEADMENRENKVQNFLNKTAAPKVITSSYDNKATAIDTPYTIRAKELRDIYNSIIMKHLTQDERLDILLTLKHTVQEHDCKLTQEILKLIDREADLLVRGVSNENLEGLRKRIATLFLQYIKTPIFNPEASKFIKVPPDPTKISGRIYFCTSCNNYLLSTQFPLNVNARNPGSCQQCKKKDNEGRYRTDYSSYRHMLKVLRMTEEQHNDGSAVAFIFQEADICYLVEKIWGSESIISNNNDLYDLIFIRWDSEIPWSPWNCLLVTIEEAENHAKIGNIYKGYDQVFINKINQKHQLAKHYFSRLHGTAELLCKQQAVESIKKKEAFSKQTSCSTLYRQ